MKRIAKNIHYNLIPEIDWARLAAYIDGEGCILISKRRETKNPRAKTGTQHMKVFIANTDTRLMNWLRFTFGGVVNGVPRQDRTKHKPCYTWTVCSEVAWLVLLCCEPYFVAKKDQAEVALKFQRTMSRQRRWSGVPQEIMDFRDACYAELRRLKTRRFYTEASSLTT